jgi:hypothetical protein
MIEILSTYIIIPLAISIIALGVLYKEMLDPGFSKYIRTRYGIFLVSTITAVAFYFLEIGPTEIKQAVPAYIFTYGITTSIYDLAGQFIIGAIKDKLKALVVKK